MAASSPGVSTPPDPSFRQRVLAGEQLFGTFLNLGSSLTAEIVALAGFDWALVDTEHGPGAEWHAVAQLQALGRTPGLVRVESLERTRILRALDAGAAGVLVPRLESADDARRAVTYARYAGERGVARSNRAWHWGSRGGALADADAAVVTAVQIETAGALEAVDAIAAVDGVDVVFVGPNDLAHAIGLQGGPLAPDFVAHMQTVAAAARRHGKAAGIQVAAVEHALAYRDLGFTVVGCGSDGSMLMEQARRNVAALR
jgi:2-keto-3-deoxy-L-rhamnonate aldolase RhmA